jgi:hypothetical protein
MGLTLCVLRARDVLADDFVRACEDFPELGFIGG